MNAEGKNNRGSALGQAGLILGLSLVTALAVNLMSPRRIDWVGQWDVEKGVVSAGGRSDVVSHDLEIPSVNEAFAIYQAGQAVFLDARSPDMYREGHIKGAVSLFVYDYDALFENFVNAYPDRNRLMVTYCSGRECEDSHMLARYLEDDGYTRVRVFIDGYPAWNEEGLPVETGD